MIPQEYTDLMNLEIDGMISPDDARRLADYLAQHVEARTHYRELRESLGIFARVPLLEPPDSLRPQVLAAVGRAPARRGWWSTFRARPGYAYAFAAGLGVGLLLLGAINRIPERWTPESSSDLFGTIVAEVAAGRGKAGESLSIELPGVAGTVRTYAAGDEILIRLGLQSDRPIDVRLEYDEHLACEGYRAGNPGSCDITVSGKQILLNHNGQGDYDIVLQHAELILPSIRMQILENRSVLFEETIAPAQI